MRVAGYKGMAYILGKYDHARPYFDETGKHLTYDEAREREKHYHVMDGIGTGKQSGIFLSQTNDKKGDK